LAPRTGFLLSILVLTVTGCGGSSGSDAASAPVPSRTVAPCPGSSHPSRVGAWPKPLPPDLPKPPGSGKAHVALRNINLTVISVPTDISLRESVLYVLSAFPPKGFTLGRGDAEPGQADAPFTRNGVFGQVRLNMLGSCRTEWLIAVGNPQGTGGTSPLLPPPSATPGTQFQPFGG
jgi:hypothetical protein